MSDRCQHVDAKYDGWYPTYTKCKRDTKFLHKEANIFVCADHAPLFATLIDIRDLDKKAV